jgi:DMSO/TMAO reductase YedYZ molybdopterin-dependent catalytic subunit
LQKHWALIGADPERKMSNWRVPPNQNLVRRKASWPVVGETTPRASNMPWTLEVSGAVEHSFSLELEELKAMPQVERVLDLHCVTRWSKLGCTFSGVRLIDVVTRAVPVPEASSMLLTARSERNHTSSLTLAEVQRFDPLIALSYEGGEIPTEHGGPIRIVTPGKYFYKSIKWLEKIEITMNHKLGYWEDGLGYHDHADPWEEERYVTGSIPPDLRQRMIETRRFGGRDLLSCVFDGEHLDGLDAHDAILRNTSFVNASLSKADFSGAKLINARLMHSNLREAQFNGTDAKGSDFRGADLTGADFSGSVLFGVNFCRSDGSDGAVLTDAVIPSESIEELDEVQAAYVQEALKKDSVTR